MQERRTPARARVLKSAKLILGTSSTIDCVIRNISNEGAKIEISNAATLPGELELSLDGGHTVRRCRIVWRTLTAAGLKFEA